MKYWMLSLVMGVLVAYGPNVSQAKSKKGKVMSESKSVEHLDQLKSLVYTYDVDGGMEKQLTKKEVLKIDLDSKKYELEINGFGETDDEPNGGELSQSEIDTLMTLLRKVQIEEKGKAEKSTGGAMNTYIDLQFKKAKEFRLYISGRDGRKNEWEAVRGTAGELITFLNKFKESAQ